MSSRQEIITAVAKAARVPETIAAAALAIEGTPEFRHAYKPCLNGELHPASVAMAEAAAEACAVKVTAGQYGKICDVVERNYHGRPLTDDSAPYLHSSPEARAAAMRIIEILGLEHEDPRDISRLSEETRTGLLLAPRPISPLALAPFGCLVVPATALTALD